MRVQIIADLSSGSSYTFYQDVSMGESGVLPDIIRDAYWGLITELKSIIETADQPLRQPLQSPYGLLPWLAILRSPSLF
jgi:hypothetical protein